jgi:phosphate transport system substrate-binding protein
MGLFPTADSTARESADRATPAAPDFVEQAAQAGLILPTPKKQNPLLVAVIVIVIVVASLGIGRATGWLNPAAPAQAPFNCNGVSIRMWGGVSETPGRLPSVMAAMGSAFANATTGCGNVVVDFNASAGNGSLAALSSRSVDFSVVSEFPTPSELAALPAATLVVPVSLGGLGVVANLPGASLPLNLTSAALAGIYLGTIKSWSDPAIARYNPGVLWPANTTIHPFFLAGSSALSDAFSTFLAETNATWSSYTGGEPPVTWPAGTGLATDSAMVQNLSDTPGAIGYLEQGTAIGRGLTIAQVENANGTFQPPNTQSVSTAVESALLALPSAKLNSVANGSWANISIINAPGAGSYPIAVFSYLIVYGDLGRTYGAALNGLSARIASVLLWWMVSSGQSIAAAEGLTPLPAIVSLYSAHGLSELSYNGSPLYPTPHGEGGEAGGNETGEF